jgi:hypothetical protein
MSRAAVADPLRAGESDADTRIRHGDHHGGRWNGAWAGGGQIAGGSAEVHSDKEDVVPPKMLLRTPAAVPAKGPGVLRYTRPCRCGLYVRRRHGLPGRMGFKSPLAIAAGDGGRELACDNFWLLPWTSVADRVRSRRMPPSSREHLMLGFSQVTRPRIPVAASPPGNRHADGYDREAHA